MPKKTPAPADRILVLCVDRDDDIGQKTSIKGPIIGREACLETASTLALADPQESDANAIYQAVRMLDELKKKHSAEIAILTGHPEVGLASDEAVAKQLVSVTEKFPAQWAVVVADGAEDEHVLPIIQSRLPILSVNRVVVKQNERLESGYYVIKDFINESLENPRFARLIFGLPAIAFILYAVFGIEGWRAVVGLFGVYLFIKGFKLEQYVYGGLDELRTSLNRSRFAFFMYVISLVFAAFAIYRGSLGYNEFIHRGFFEGVAGLVSSSVYMILFAAIALWIGKNIKYKARSARSVAGGVLFGVAVSLVVSTAADLIILTEITALNFLLSLVIGFILMGIGLLVEWKG